MPLFVLHVFQECFRPYLANLHVTIAPQVRIRPIIVPPCALLVVREHLPTMEPLLVQFVKLAHTKMKKEKDHVFSVQLVHILLLLGLFSVVCALRVSFQMLLDLRVAIHARQVLHKARHRALHAKNVYLAEPHRFLE